MPTNVTIPEVDVVFQRQDWEPGNYEMDTDFHRTPSALQFDRVDRIATHYTAALDISDGDPGETQDQVRQLMANITVSYYNNKKNGGYQRLADGKWFPGFPFGYSFAVDHWGAVWVGRGWDFIPAATGGHNTHTIAILMLTDLKDPGSEAMWRSFRMISREAKRRGAPLHNDPWAHGWFAERLGYGTPTGCCGDALKAQINAGLGNLDYKEKEADMAQMRAVRIRFDGYADQLVAFPPGGQDFLKAAELFDDPVVVLGKPTSAQKAALEKELGRPLTAL